MFTSNSGQKLKECRIVACVQEGPNHGVMITACGEAKDGADLGPQEFKLEPDSLTRLVSEKDLRNMVKAIKGQARAANVEAAMEFARGDISESKLPDDLSDLPDMIKDFMSARIQKQMVTSGKFRYVPNTNRRDSIYVAGVSGAGKSFWVADYLEFYKKLFPDSKIYLFSEKLTEPIFDKFNMTRIAMKELDENGQFILISDPIEPLTELEEGSLVIFDDVDSIRHKHLKKEVFSIAETIFKVGRSRGMSVIMTSHTLSNYRETRDFISESNIKVIFPRRGSKHFSREFMKTYVGLGKKEAERVYDLDSRAVVFHCDHPSWILSDHELKMMR